VRQQDRTWKKILRRSVKGRSSGVRTRGQVGNNKQWKRRAPRNPKDTEGRSLQASRDPGSGGEGSGVSERRSGVSGQQRWSQAERCLARGRYTLHYNILNPFRPAEGPSEGKARTGRVSKGQWSQWSVQVVPGRALPRPWTIHLAS